MSAPVLNLGFTPAAGAAPAGAAAAQGQGQGGAAAGFEALLAALFGEAQPTGAVPVGDAKPAATDSGVAADGKSKDGKSKSAKSGDAQAKDGEAPAGADAQILAASLIGAAAPTPTPPPLEGGAENGATSPGAKAAPAGGATTTGDDAAKTVADAKSTLAAAAGLTPAPQTDKTPPPVATPPRPPSDAASAPQPAAAQQTTAQPAPAPVAAATLTAAQLEAQHQSQDAATIVASAQTPTTDPRRDPRLLQTGVAQSPGAAAVQSPSDAQPIVIRIETVASTLATTQAERSTAHGAAQALEPEPAAARDAHDTHAQPPADATATANAAPLPHVQAPVIVRGAPETVASLTAHILKKLDGRSTRFDVELEPAGLGRVDVRLEIGASGRLSAAMSFDNPQAAAELKSRSAELTRALEQAGFDVSGGLSFNTSGDQGGSRQDGGGEQNAGSAMRGRAFQAALASTSDAVDPSNSSLYLRSRMTSGIDIRI